VKGAVGGKAKSIDEFMDRASVALVATDYFEAEKLCLRAMSLARASNDFERMARITLPLQEARRQRRQWACDVPGCHLLGSWPEGNERIASGRYLLHPPLVGIDAQALRVLSYRQKVAITILVREPTTRAGKWPIVGVGSGPREPVVVRIQLDPPTPPTHTTASTPPTACNAVIPSNDFASTSDTESFGGDSRAWGGGCEVDLAWYMRAHEALGDAAIKAAPKDVPADHHVDDLIDLLEAVPDHEKLIQALAEACRVAAKEPLSSVPRRRPMMEDAFSF